MGETSNRSGEGSEKKDLVLLYSGGADSTLLLKMAIQMDLHPLCVFINYEQKHIDELKSAVRQCDELQVSLRLVSIAGLNVHSKLTDGEQTYEGVSPWHVPSRNLMFIAIAASIAESEGIPLIWYGANYEDREHLFPDCYQEWVYQLNQLLQINGSTPIKVEAPLLGMTKETIWKLCESHNINKNEIFSGYGTQETNN